MDEAEAETPADLGLQPLDLLGAELKDRAAAEVDQMVVVLPGRLFVARAPVPELQAFDDALALEELDRAIDGGQRDAIVDRGGAAVQFDHVRMVLRFVEDARDHAPLSGHAQPMRRAGPFDDAGAAPNRPLGRFNHPTPPARSSARDGVVYKDETSYEG